MEPHENLEKLARGINRWTRVIGRSSRLDNRSNSKHRRIRIYLSIANHACCFDTCMGGEMVHEISADISINGIDRVIPHTRWAHTSFVDKRQEHAVAVSLIHA